MSVDVAMKEDFIELVQIVFLKCNLRVKLWKSIGERLW